MIFSSYIVDAFALFEIHLANNQKFIKEKYIDASRDNKNSILYEAQKGMKREKRSEIIRVHFAEL